MTPIGDAAKGASDPADIYVLYPGEGSERHLSSSFFIRIEGAEWGTAEDGIVILALSAVVGYGAFDLLGSALVPREMVLGVVRFQVPGSFRRRPQPAAEPFLTVQPNHEILTYGKEIPYPRMECDK